MPSRRWFALDVAITGVRVDEGLQKVAITDRARRHRVVDLATLNLEKVTNFYRPAQAPFDYYQRSMCMLGLNTLFFWPRESECGYLVEIGPAVSFVFRFTHHQSAVSKVALSHCGTRLLSGDEQGRSYVLNLSNGNIEHRLPAFPDTVSAVCFSRNDTLFSVAGFHGSLVSYDAFTGEKVSHFKPNSVVEAMEYLDENTVIAVLRDGRILKADAKRGKILKETTLDAGLWPSMLFIAPNKKFCFVGTRQSRLLAFHITSLEQMFTLDFGCGGVSVLGQSKDFFFVGFTSGELVILNYREHEKEFSQSVELGNIAEANGYFEKNVFLMTHESTWNMYEQWLEAKKSITTLLSEGAVEKAQQEARPFMFHPKCRYEMEALEEQQGLLATLLRCIKNRDFPRAYELCEKHPVLKESEHFKKLEQMWRLLFGKAQRLLGRDPVLNKQAAKEVLALFLQVPEKNHEVALMFKHLGAFQKAEEAVRAKDFERYYVLAEQFSFLKETALYEKVGWLQEELKQKLQLALSEQRFEEALEIAKVLGTFAPSASYANAKTEHIKKILSLDALLRSGRMLEACAVVSELGLWNEEYTSVQYYKKAKEKFVRLLQRQILEGRAKEVYGRIALFIKNKEGAAIHQRVMRFLYEHQLSTHVRHETRHRVDWEKTLRHFSQFFALTKALDDKLRLAGIPPVGRAKEEEKSQEVYPLSIIHYR